MRKPIDIGDFVAVKTIQVTTKELAERFVKRRKEQKMTQRALAIQSGVSYGSIRRFESQGDISLKSLLKLALVLQCLEDFDQLFSHPKPISLRDLK